VTTEGKPPEREDEDMRRVAGDPSGPGDEGERSAQGTPPIGEEGEPGQTAVPAPEEDVGVPEDPGRTDE
jgi:hypothetical protein